MYVQLYTNMNLKRVCVFKNKNLIVYDIYLLKLIGI